MSGEKERQYLYRLFYMEPPIKQEKKPKILDLEATCFENAYQFSKAWVKENKAEGSVILMMAQLDR